MFWLYCWYSATTSILFMFCIHFIYGILQNGTSKEKMEEWESLTLMWTKEYLLVTQVQENHTSVTTQD
jgi:hypothetical protein